MAYEREKQTLSLSLLMLLLLLHLCLCFKVDNKFSDAYSIGVRASCTQCENDMHGHKYSKFIKLAACIHYVASKKITHCYEILVFASNEVWIFEMQRAQIENTESNRNNRHTNNKKTSNNSRTYHTIVNKFFILYADFGVLKICWE